jgi:hypothetical protein
MAVAERFRDYLELVFIHDVADSIGLQHLHGGTVILKNGD